MFHNRVRSRSVADPDNQQRHFSMFGRHFRAPFLTGRRRDAFRLIAVVSFCITSLRLRTLSGVFKLLSTKVRTGGRPWPGKCVPISFERETHHDCWTGIDATPVKLGDFAGRSCENRSFSRRKGTSRNNSIPQRGRCRLPRTEIGTADGAAQTY